MQKYNFSPWFDKYIVFLFVCVLKTVAHRVELFDPFTFQFPGLRKPFVCEVWRNTCPTVTARWARWWRKPVCMCGGADTRQPLACAPAGGWAIAAMPFSAWKARMQSYLPQAWHCWCDVSSIGAGVAFILVTWTVFLPAPAESSVGSKCWHELQIGGVWCFEELPGKTVCNSACNQQLRARFPFF